MAKGGKRKSILDLRREAEAVEARDKEKVESEAEEVEEEADADADAESDDGDDEDGVKKKKKPAAKKKAAPKVKKPTVKRVRVAKEVRQKAVWVVFDNASKRVEAFPFNQKADAEALLARKVQEKEGKATFYLNLVKEPLE